MTQTKSIPHNYFEEQCLPDRTKRYVNQIQKKTGAPIDMIVLMLLTVYSEAAQGTFDIHMPDGSISPIGIYSLLIAESGEGKSSVLNMIRKPIVELEREFSSQYNQRMSDFLIKEKIWATRDTALVKELSRTVRKAQPTEEIEQLIQQHQNTRNKKPRLLKLSYNKFTPEGFLLGLKNNWPNVGINLDEANDFFNGRAAYDLTPLLHCWEGKCLTKDTSSGETSVFVKSPRVAGVFALQSSVLQRYFERRPGEARGIGLWARFITCKPESTQGSRDIACMSKAKVELDELYARIRELILNSIGDDDEPVERKLLRFEFRAHRYLIKLGQQIEDSMSLGGELATAKDHASKKIRNICRIAAVMHLFECEGQDIDLYITEKAAAIMNYYTEEFLKIFAEPEEKSQLQQDADLLWDWMDTFATKHNNRYILKSELLKLAVPTRLRKVNQLNPVIDHLNKSGKIATFYFGYNYLQYIDLEPTKNWDQNSFSIAMSRYTHSRKRTLSPHNL